MAQNYYNNLGHLEDPLLEDLNQHGLDDLYETPPSIVMPLLTLIYMYMDTFHGSSTITIRLLAITISY